MEQEKYEKTRCNVYLPKFIVEELDNLAKVYGGNRSVMISMIVKMYMDQQRVVELAEVAKRSSIDSKLGE